MSERAFRNKHTNECFKVLNRGKAAHRELWLGAVDASENRRSLPGGSPHGSVTVPGRERAHMAVGRAEHSKGTLEVGAVKKSAETSAPVVLATSPVARVDAVGGVEEGAFEKKVEVSYSAYHRVLNTLRADSRSQFSHISQFAALFREPVADLAARLSLVRLLSLSETSEPTATCNVSPG